VGYSDDFEEVWKFLGSCGAEGLEWKKRSVKKTAFLRWKSLKEDEKADAIRGIPLFIGQVKEDRRRFERQFCMFDVYLNQARWENLIEMEKERIARIDAARACAEKREREKPQQATLTLVVPTDERKARLDAANSSLINQYQAIIKPVIAECVALDSSRPPVVAKKKWDELRRKMPYLPENWQEVKFG
jgi:hypothetical protein